MQQERHTLSIKVGSPCKAALIAAAHRHDYTVSQVIAESVGNWMHAHCEPVAAKEIRSERGLRRVYRRVSVAPDPDGAG